jgi:hypothetical protein
MFNIRKNKTLSLQYKKRKFPNSNVGILKMDGVYILPSYEYVILSKMLKSKYLSALFS